MELILQKVLDREKQPSIHLTLTAVGGEKKTDLERLLINVHATDLDEGVNWEITYAFVNHDKKS